MNIRKSMLTMGLLILLAGLFILLLSVSPTPLIKYIVVASAFIAGVLALMIGRKAIYREVASRFISTEGVVLVLYAVAATIFGGNLISFITITTLFLLIFGMVEFTLTLQSLNTSGTPNWSVFVQKLVVAVGATVGAVYIYATSAWDSNLAVLFVGVVTMFIGTSFLNESRHVAAPQRS